MTITMRLTKIIQGGMGAGVSNWRLARAVSLAGQLGVVSGTALDTILARRLQLGDLGGHMRRALAAFPFKEIAERVRERYFLAGGKAPERPFRSTPVPSLRPSRDQLELIVVANFVEVFLAKEQHSGLVGINYLEKIQLPTLPSIFGAMLAGVNCILMGAGIPRAIPGILDRLSRGAAVEMAVVVEGDAAGEESVVRFDPRAFAAAESLSIGRPDFLAIVASAPLAAMLARKASGRVDGFVVEGPSAGGHNAPPRGAMQLSGAGEPLYGARDVVDLASFRELGSPFWLAGSYGRPGALREALDEGAAGIQVGTAFAFCEESGVDSDLIRRILAGIDGQVPAVRTEPKASPTGFPFKVVQLEGTLSDPCVRAARERVCDLGYLRQGYTDDRGRIGWRCPAEPERDYLRKGGALEDTFDRYCVCNGLLATIGLGQRRADGSLEAALVTSGDELAGIRAFLPDGANSYSAGDVVRRLLEGTSPSSEKVGS